MTFDRCTNYFCVISYDNQGNLKGEYVAAAILPSLYGGELLYLQIIFVA